MEIFCFQKVVVYSLLPQSTIDICHSKRDVRLHQVSKTFVNHLAFFPHISCKYMKEI